ncbi:hypothetical protein N7492_007941 [Penicillium capsulatum]|uniref:Uncharacterized protein n=1 Tax=Penicillium capsulatum TaxID=69766 RepID=A0A9W9I264_9EURO|nr:hypothetical protein N7492_007941 [Penicillium capsulatum]KAJ6117770.1 hypothetical protein N7512_007495 [Penicillium capsulatum]
MKAHWSEQHTYCVHKGSGRPTPAQAQTIQANIEKNSHRVYCQRVFTQGPGSHYIRIAQSSPDAAPEPVANIDSVDRQGDLDEATPWLNRTGWVQYLQGTPREPLGQSIARPKDDAEGPERAALAIWEAMARLAKVSQDVAKSCGHLLRIDIARTMKDESPHSPLLAYLNAAGIQKHVEPWQQILMFFARTQVNHNWRSPEYKFTPRQQRSWDIVWRHAQSRPASPDPMDPEEWEPEPFELRPIEIALLEFCIDLLRQKIRNDEYGLLHKALRLDPQSLEIRRSFAGQNGRRWFPGDMVELDNEYIYEADEGYDSTPPSPTPMASSPPASSQMLGRFTQEQRRHPQRTFPEWVKYMVDTFMVRGTNGPVQWLLDLRTYGMKVFFNTPAEGHIGWKSGDELLYKQIHFTMGDFRGFVHGLVGRMRQQLVEELMLSGKTTPPVIPWDDLYDDPTQNAPGWSFIRDSRTRWPVQGEEWLMQRVRREPVLRQRFIQPDGQGFRMHAIDRFFRVVSQFRERLAVAIHVSAGQPSRGPELMSIRHRNSERERRNIFIEDRMVVFVSRYHKGFHVHNDTKVIFRYLPRELGELVVWYLWLVLPFVEQMQSYQRHFRGASPAVAHRAEYIWSPDPDRETEF